MLVLTPRIRNSASAAPGPGHRGLEGAAATGQLDQHRVEVGADLHPGVGGAAVEAYAGPARGAVGGDGPGVGPEAVGRVLGGDPALQGGPVDPDVGLGQPEVGQALPRRDPHLGLDQVDVGDLLGHRVLDLDPRVHLDEDVLARPFAFGLHQELDGAGTRVVDRLGELHRIGAQRGPQFLGDVRRRGDLDDLLMPPLDRAVPLVQVQRGTLRVGQDLHLDVPRPADRLLDEGGRIPERPLRLAHRRRDQLAQHRGIIDPPHAATTTAGDGLDEDREADLLRTGDQLVQVGRGWGGLERGNARRPGGLEGPDLVAGQGEHVGRRPDEGDAGLDTGPGQIGILAQEAVTGVDRVGPGLLGGADDLGDVQIGADRMAAFADRVRLVRFDPVDGIAVLVREHGDRLGPQLVRGSERPDSDLTPVGHQHLGEHG